MRHSSEGGYRKHSASWSTRPGEEGLPNLVGSPKNPFREAYQGRWAELPAIQKSCVLIALVFWLIFIGSIIYESSHLSSWAGLLGIVAWSVGVAAILAGFYAILRWKIR
jgi:hypothetical protein